MSDKPDIVPDSFEMIDSSECGFAVKNETLWFNKEHKEFKLKFEMNESLVIRQAIESHEEMPNILKQCMNGVWMEGDIPALKQIIEALDWYEDYEAGFGEDKIAYDARTLCNHALGGIRKVTNE